MRRLACLLVLCLVIFRLLGTAHAAPYARPVPLFAFVTPSGWTAGLNDGTPWLALDSAAKQARITVHVEDVPRPVSAADVEAERALVSQLDPNGPDQMVKQSALREANVGPRHVYAYAMATRDKSGAVQVQRTIVFSESPGAKHQWVRVTAQSPAARATEVKKDLVSLIQGLTVKPATMSGAQANDVANADSCFKNRKMLTGVVEMWKLDNKTDQNPQVTPEFLAGLVASKLLVALPSDPGCGPNSVANYFTSGHPRMTVGCRVHGTGYYGPDPEKYTCGPVEISTAEDCEPIQHKLEQAEQAARKQLDALRARSTSPLDKREIVDVEQQLEKARRALAAGDQSKAVFEFHYAWKNITRLSKSMAPARSAASAQP